MKSNKSRTAGADVVADGEGCHDVVEVVVRWLVWVRPGDLALSTPTNSVMARFFRSTKLNYIVSYNKQI